TGVRHFLNTKVRVRSSGDLRLRWIDGRPTVSRPAPIIVR
ncbi:MAG: hypothetical protein QOJ85_1050, partial [Solirubrobacteraceae bacterium]|nr:hypothetical protein [Solirubrobacteraceae bacterium]